MTHAVYGSCQRAGIADEELRRIGEPVQGQRILRTDLAVLEKSRKIGKQAILERHVSPVVPPAQFGEPPAASRA